MRETKGKVRRRDRAKISSLKMTLPSVHIKLAMFGECHKRGGSWFVKRKDEMGKRGGKRFSTEELMEISPNLYEEIGSGVPADSTSLSTQLYFQFERQESIEEKESKPGRKRGRKNRMYESC